MRVGKAVGIRVGIVGARVVGNGVGANVVGARLGTGEAALGAKSTPNPASVVITRAATADSSDAAAPEPSKVPPAKVTLMAALPDKTSTMMPSDDMFIWAAISSPSLASADTSSASTVVSR